MDNDFVRNNIIFDVDNSSSSHSDNRKNNFLVLVEGPTYSINGSSGSPEKKFNIKFTEQIQNFVRVCNIMLIIVIFLLTFQHNIVSEVYLMDFSNTESTEVSKLKCV